MRFFCPLNSGPENQRTGPPVKISKTPKSTPPPQILHNLCTSFDAPAHASHEFSRRSLRQEKRAQRLSFWVRRPPGRVGVFHANGWWPKTSCPPSKLCLPWVSKRGIRDVPGILPGCPGPLAVFKKFVQKNFVRIFRSLISGLPRAAHKFCTIFSDTRHVLQIRLYCTGESCLKLTLIFHSLVFSFSLVFSNQENSLVF